MATSASNVDGYIMGMSVISTVRNFTGRRNFTGENFWARGYFVSTVGLDEEKGRKISSHLKE
jgi:putative transposase